MKKYTLKNRKVNKRKTRHSNKKSCLLYTSDAADEG